MKTLKEQYNILNEAIIHNYSKYSSFYRYETDEIIDPTHGTIPMRYSKYGKTIKEYILDIGSLTKFDMPKGSIEKLKKLNDDADIIQWTREVGIKWCCVIKGFPNTAIQLRKKDNTLYTVKYDLPYIYGFSIENRVYPIESVDGIYGGIILYIDEESLKLEKV